MIKIVHLITGLGSGGAEMSLYRLIKGMNRARFEIVVVSMTGSGPVADLIKSENIEVIDLGLKRGGLNPFALLKMVFILKKHNPDILQTWLYHSDFLGSIASRLSGSPKVIWNIRNSQMAPKDHSRILSIVIKVLAWISKTPRAIVTNSYAGKEAHELIGYHPARWEVIPNGIDTNLFKPSVEAGDILKEELGLNPGATLIGCVGRYHPMKDHASFLTAVEIISQEYPDVRFALVGKGMDEDNDELESLIEKAGVENKIFLLGERSDMEKVTAAFDIAVSSSSYGEGFSNSIAEAMSCGVPCVATDVGDSRMIIGEAGVNVPPHIPKALADGIEKILSMSRAELTGLANDSRKTIVGKFSLITTIEKYEKLYSDIMMIDQNR